MIYEEFLDRYNAVWPEHEKNFPSVNLSADGDWDNFRTKWLAKSNDEKQISVRQDKIIEEFGEALAIVYGVGDHPKKKEMFNYILGFDNAHDYEYKFDFYNVELYFSTLVELIK